MDKLSKVRSIFLAEISNITDECKIEEMEQANKRYFEGAFADSSFTAWLALSENEIVATKDNIYKR